MTEYNFFAQQTLEGAEVIDRWRLHADTYEEACELAQQLEYREAEELERDPVHYDTFTEVAVKND